jgi:heat shock protein HslJ
MSPQKKAIIIACAVLTITAIILAALYYIKSTKDVDMLPPEDAKGISLSCSNGYTGKATYYDADKNGVTRRLLLVAAQGEDIKQHLMLTTVSASGAKFTTRDGMTSLWGHQGEFTFEQNGTALAVCKDASKQTFILDGELVTLTNGFLEKEIAPGSVTKDTVRYFGNEATGDINGDGRDDRIFFVTKESGGTGVFYYVVGMLATDVLPKGTKAVLVGDRKTDEAFTVEPSVGKTLRLKLDTIALDFGEVAQDFEGEADASRMELSMKEWKWIKTTYSTDKEVFPVKKEAFLATFTKDGQVSVATDCNTMSAEYVAATSTLSFGPFMSTRMFCDGSQETEFQAMLTDIEKFSFTSRGELLFTLKKDQAVMLFK